jgi:DNA integrity scanning protein DisA with diadenylate cyclase activity
MDAPRRSRANTSAILDLTAELARQARADLVVVVADRGIPRASIVALRTLLPVLVVTSRDRFLAGIESAGVGRIQADFGIDDPASFERIRQGVVLGMERGHIRRGSRLVCVTGMIDRGGVDALVVVDTSRGFEGFHPDSVAELAGDLPIEVVKALLDIAVDIGQEGREGDPVGSLFVLGDAETVMRHSRPMTFDPFRGYSEREKNITNPDIREGIKEVALMDGAFIIQEDGVVLSAGRYIASEVKGVTLPKGLGARHVAAASITKNTKAIALAVSETTGTVRAFRRGQMVLRIDPPRRRLRQDRLR